MSSSSHPTTGHQPFAGADHLSTHAPEPESVRVCPLAADLLGVPSTAPPYVESSLAIRSGTHPVIQESGASSMEHGPPSPISPLHLGPSILSQRLSSRDHGAPPTPYHSPRHLGSPRVFPTVPREIGFGSSCFNSLSGTGYFPLHRFTAKTRDPERPRLPPIHCLSDLGRTESSVASPSTTPGGSHIPDCRFPLFPLPAEGSNGFGSDTCSHAPSRLTPAPGFGEPHFLDSRTLENNLSTHDLITLAIRRDLPLRSMIINRLHRLYGNKVPVFPGEAREFEHYFEAPWPGSLCLQKPQVPVATPFIASKHKLSPSARNEARRRTSRMDLDFITNEMTVGHQLPGGLDYPRPTDDTNMYMGLGDSSERSSERSRERTRRSRGHRDPYSRPPLVTRKARGSISPSSPLLDSFRMGHRNSVGSPGEGSSFKSATGLKGSWRVVRDE